MLELFLNLAGADGLPEGATLYWYRVCGAIGVPSGRCSSSTGYRRAVHQPP